jgi:hypothetical protein
VAIVGRTTRIALIGTTCLLAVIGVSATLPPAMAATDPAIETLTAVERATRLAAQSGLDVIQVVKVSYATKLSVFFVPKVNAKVSGGTRVRIHVLVAADDAFYISVRQLPSAWLLGAAGSVGPDGPWWGP